MISNSTSQIIDAAPKIIEGAHKVLSQINPIVFIENKINQFQGIAIKAGDINNIPYNQELT